ncbi:hypothetical protein DL95DRAFT_136592 [Leptodontidium sp. 2 PMI_412]|nr:hypothetical protein DL95DRAFT_136592 [Leptodontidium sp. 2 PMI_412]
MLGPVVTLLCAGVEGAAPMHDITLGKILTLSAPFPVPVSRKRAPESTVPFARDPNFVGRQDVFTDLELRLCQTNSHSRAVLVGLGGVGKSQIAIEYSYRRREKDPDLWVS